MKVLPPTPMLRSFESAARNCNISKAAVELHLTTSAVSHQITSLEKYWKTKLFTRHSRGVTLTDSGRHLLQPVVAFIRDMDIALAAISVHTTIDLRITCTPSLLNRWLLPRIDSYVSKYAESVNVIIESSDEPFEVQSHNQYVGIRIGNGAYKNLYAEHLFTDQVFPVCTTNYLLEHRNLLSDFTKIKFIETIEDDICPTWNNWFKYAGIENKSYSTVLTYESSQLAIEAALREQGVALARSSLVWSELKNSKLVIISDRLMPSDTSYYFVCRDGDERLDHIQSFLKWIKHKFLEFSKSADNDTLLKFVADGSLVNK